ncbi:MAG TPA: hypothetical protein VGZ90_13495 [Puia sp.]|jgi:hypothetical protein|nr:hypothetical protein [Puia sp.]
MISSNEQFMQERENEDRQSRQYPLTEAQSVSVTTGPERQFLYDTIKEERIRFAHDILRQIEEGVVDPLKIHLQLKSTEQMIGMLNDADKYPDTAIKYKAAVLAAAEKYGKKFTLHNSEFQIKEAGVKYDYSKCGDDRLTKLMADYKELGDVIKKQQEFLKTVDQSGIGVLDPETGELATLYPPSKSSTTIVQVTVK